MRKLILFFQQTDLMQPSWAVVNESGTVQQTSWNTRPDSLAMLAADKEVIVIVPSEDVLLTQTTLPKLSRQKLAKALPFALEEQVLDDVSELHFAMGPYQPENPLPVAIIKHSTMKRWIAAFTELDLRPIAIIPAALALPMIQNNWFIAVKEDIATVRFNTFRGFACDKNNLKELLTSELKDNPEAPQVITVCNYSASALPLTIDGIHIIEKNCAPTQFIEDIARNITIPPINLLQGAYQAKRGISHSKKIWRAAGYVVLAWIAIAFISNLISFLILHHQASLTQEAMTKIYKKHFPQASALVAPKERMSEKLSALTTSGGKNRILVWLGYIAKSVSQQPALRIQQFDYRNNQLTLEFSAPNFTTVDAFTRTLSAYGIAVKPQHVASVGAQVKGSLLITEGGKS